MITFAHRSTFLLKYHLAVFAQAEEQAFVWEVALASVPEDGRSRALHLRGVQDLLRGELSTFSQEGISYLLHCVWT